MTVVENGKVQEPSQDRLKTQSERRKKNKPRRSYLRLCLALIARLCIWYVVLTPFFHCPSNISELEKSSPRVCKPYLIARSHLEPHIDPYYQKYAAPYVELVRPYAHTFNERIYTPAYKIAKHGYDTYGAPALEQAGKYSHQQWEAVIVPQLYSAQVKVNDVYKASVDPYVQQTLVFVSPYSNTVRNKLKEAKDKYLLPLYVQSKPFIGKTYSSGQDLMSGTVVPFAQKAWSSLLVFVKGTVWPSITGLYSENVEPQLVKIGEKLATYREGKKLRTAMDEVESLIEEPATSTQTVLSESVFSSQTTKSSSTSHAAETKTPLTSEQKIAQAREQIASDLRVWQEKFAAAADKGVEDLGERIQEIVSSQLESGAKMHGESLLEALETVVDHEFSNLKTQINALVDSLPAVDAPQEEENAMGDLLKAVRSAGLAIRDRAHAVREWHKAFEDELIRRVSAASESTLDVLDSIRDLGLQEIGMRWAWMDGVTYKDWEKYHAVRKQFDDWRSEVHDFGMNHEKVEEAKAVANDILSRGMAIAEEAAKELTRLREVGKWKIEAREVSDNFETRTEPPPPRVKPAAEAVDEDISRRLDEESQSAILRDGEPSEATDADGSSSISGTETQDVSSDDNEISQNQALPEELSSASEEVLADQDPISAEASPTPLSTDVASSTIQETSTESQSPSSKIWGGASAQVLTEQQPILEIVDYDEEKKFTEQIQHLASEAGERYAEATKAVSEALFGPSSTPNLGDKAASVASDQYSRAFAAASSILYGTAPGPGEQFASAAFEKYQQAVVAASSAFYGSPRPTTKTGPLQSISSIASSGAPIPTPLSSHFQDFLEEAEAHYSQAYSSASASLAAVVASVTSAMGSTTEGTARDIVDDASSRYSAALSAASTSLSLASASASSALYGTPKGTLEVAASKASENWENLISRASEQVYGTPAPSAQQQPARYEALESLISELVAGKEPEFSQSVMNWLLSAYETPYPATALSSASSHANDAYTSASSQVSEAVYGTQLGYVAAARSQVDEAFSSAQSALSTAIYGTSTGPAEPAFSAASGAYASVTSAVVDNVSAATSVINSVNSDLHPRVSSALSPEQQDTLESTQARPSDLASEAGDYASEVDSSAASVAGDYQSGSSSTAGGSKDEL